MKALAPSIVCLCLVALTSSLFAQETKEKTVPVFKDGEAQIVDGFKNRRDWIRHELWVETEFDTDGDEKKDRMWVSVTRPKQTETEGLKLPVVYVTSPYFAGTAGLGSFFWDPKHELGENPPERKKAPEVKQRAQKYISSSHIGQWVPRGYIVVHSCSPGTGKSQGCPTVGGENESLAPKAVVDWLCGRAKGYTSPDGDVEVKATWCNGNVGMTGTSYNGTLPLACATTGVKGLKAIIPIAPNTSYYHYYRSNGLIRHPGGYMGEDIDVLYDFINSGDPKKREHCNCTYRDEAMWKNFDRIKGDYNEWWAGRDYLHKVKNIKAAVLMAHAFNDWNVMPEHSVRIYEELKKQNKPCQAFFHQGGHGGPPPMKQMNRWFTKYLHGVDNGVEKDPKSWIVREGDRRTNPTSYAEYPHPKAQMVKLHLNKGGLTAGALVTDSMGGQGREKLIDDVSISGERLARADSSKHRLLYVTPKLKSDVHISGTAKIKIKMASSKPACNLSIWVVSLPWKARGRITDNIITRGWADLQNHKSLTKSEPLKPGQFYEMTFDLQPDDQVIPAGQQIGLMIFSSDRDFTLWPKAGTELTLDLDGTTFELPIVGGTKSFTKVLEEK